MISFASAAMFVEVTIQLTFSFQDNTSYTISTFCAHEKVVFLVISYVCSSKLTIFCSISTPPSSNGDFADNVNIKAGAVRIYEELPLHAFSEVQQRHIEEEVTLWSCSKEAYAPSSIGL